MHSARLLMFMFGFPLNQLWYSIKRPGTKQANQFNFDPDPKFALHVCQVTMISVMSTFIYHMIKYATR